MTSKSKIIWTLKEFIISLRRRQLNKFDVNIGVSGRRGSGKSTMLFKLFNSFKQYGFNQEKHQVYSQDDVIKLLSTQEFGFCWDDEAINSGYKRDFQKAGQKVLVKIVTNFRDSHNIYASALPFFYSLDKDLRELIFCHLHIIERGLAVILLPLADQIHESDPWDTKKNIKIEEREHARIAKNPDLKFRYHKLTTFAGYLYFGPMTAKQEKKYKEIKKRKRAKNFGVDNQDTSELPFKDKVFKLLLEGKMTKDGLIQACLLEGKKYSSMLTVLNGMLKDQGDARTTKDFFRLEEIKATNTNRGPISKLVPSISS
jgi:hypothetical protein